MCVTVGYTHAYSQGFKDRQRKGNNVEKCDKSSTKGRERILIGREAVTRRRGDLRMTDNEVGG